jgi:carotenoid cleavage dioxygenase-like enzyme
MNGNYQYIYGVSINRKNPFSFYNQMVKIDLKNAGDTIWYEDGSYPGEPVFISRPGKQQEDDGVILSVVLNEKAGNSYLLVLDAQSFTEIARAEIPHPILFGYHGEYFQ